MKMCVDSYEICGDLGETRRFVVCQKEWWRLIWGKPRLPLYTAKWLTLSFWNLVDREINKPKKGNYRDEDVFSFGQVKEGKELSEYCRSGISN